MSNPVSTITPDLLREWALPSGADSKYARGSVLVVGGASSTPGAVLLAGTAALRVGTGRLSMAVAGSVAPALAVAMPESAVLALPESSAGAVLAEGAARLEQAFAATDVVLIGPGLDDADETQALLRALSPLGGESTSFVLDAYALGVLPELGDALEGWAGRLVLTPNKGEAERLLGRDIRDLEVDIPELARRYNAVVTCFGLISSPDGRRWRLGSGPGGLGTSGSGDVRAGAIAGLMARGADPAQAACWGSHLHITAGDRLSARIGPTGFLARELIDELPSLLLELGQRA
ncbi:NAD(P)H-hydrate dehydratase [Parafrigoribacterium soli]|uniref:NAD(P)H-hydrate dehydratase n=1 Tax=Parafrigoribacterium soli TaxID=3144663 RepID=UPI0032EB9E4D